MTVMVTVTSLCGLSFSPSTVNQVTGATRALGGGPAPVTLLHLPPSLPLPEGEGGGTPHLQHLQLLPPLLLQRPLRLQQQSLPLIEGPGGEALVLSSETRGEGWLG